MGRTNVALRAAATEDAGVKAALRESPRDTGAMAADAAELRRLEKRYGDVGLLLKKRADELGLDMTPKTDGIVRVDDGGRTARHLSEYDGTCAGLLSTNIRNVVNLYDVRIGGVERELHVIWLFKDIDEFTKNRYRYGAYLKRDGMLYRESYDHKAKHPGQLSARIFDAVYRDPSFMVEMDEFLLRAFVEAVKFYEWNSVPNGMVITGGPGDVTFVNVRATIAFGNDALGVYVGRQLTEYLLWSANAGSLDGLDKEVKALLVHELTHLHRNDCGEIAAYAIMLLLDHKDNARMLRTVFKEFVDSWIDKQERLDDHDAMKHERSYELQRYIGLMLAANELAKHNPGIRELFDSDTTENKLIAARYFFALIRESDVEKVVASGFVEALLNHGIREMVQRIEITMLG